MKLNSEFFAEPCAPATFRLAKKFGEINPLSLEWVTQFIRPVTNEGVDKHNQILFFNQKFEVKKESRLLGITLANLPFSMIGSEISKIILVSLDLCHDQAGTTIIFL